MTEASPLPVTFLSDYGLDDEFVAVCKGIVLQVVPRAVVLDVTHGISPGNVRAGALALARAISYLPIGVHLAVVDPGVGTGRLAIAARATDGRFFVGPDNGLLGPAVALSGGLVEAVALDSSRWGMPDPSPTFHGRDVFAPAAGALAGGVSLAELGEAVDPAGLYPLLLPLCQVGSDGTIRAELLWVDRFGNCQTNVSEDDLTEAGVAPGDVLGVTFGEERRARVPWARTFGEVAPGEPLAFVDSTGQLALAVNGGSAAAEFGLGEGAAVTVSRAAKRLQ